MSYTAGQIITLHSVLGGAQEAEIVSVNDGLATWRYLDSDETFVSYVTVLAEGEKPVSPAALALDPNCGY